MQPFLIQHFLENSARISPEKIAVIHQTREITYSQLDYHANQLSHFLIDQGIQKGDRIAIILENSIEFIIAYYAVAKVGAVSVPLNIELTDDYLLNILNNCEVSTIICSSHRTKFSKKILRKVPSCKLLIAHAEKIEGWPFSLPEIFETISPAFNPPQIIDLDLASIIYTSGSTSQPRGVVLSHLNLVQNGRSIITYLKLSASCRILVVLPFFYIYGLSLLNTHFLVGGTVVLENQILFPNVVIQTLKKSKADGFAGVPATFALLLNRSTFRQENFPDLRYVTQAGGPMAPAITQELIELLPGKQIFIMYGATEASARLAYLDPEQVQAKLGSVGKAIPNVELKIVNDQGEICKPGEIGEIVARGSNIMQGYWQAPEETAHVLKNDGFHTSDLARVDSDGFIYIMGRTNDMIKSGAHRISALEIEAVLMQSPEVYEVAVIGVPDPLLGEAIRAFIVPRNNSHNGIILNLKKFCDGKLPKMKIPRYFELVKELPKNSSGKIMKEILRQKCREEI